MKECPACYEKHMVIEECRPILIEKAERLEENLSIALDALEQIEKWSETEIFDIAKQAIAEINANTPT